MNWNNFGKFSGMVLAIIIVFVMYISPLASSIKQGLDLQGGTHLVLEAVDTPDAKVDEDALNRVVKIIERRINELGLTEPIIQREGANRIIVELPGINDPEKAIALVGKTALLEFKDPTGKTVLTGKDLKNSKAHMDQSKRAMVGIEFTDEGAKRFGELTTKFVRQPIAIALDGEVLTNPVVNEPITGGSAVITGSRTMEEAEHLAILLRSGSLPVKMDLIENRTVGPSLGEDSKTKSIQAFAIGIAGITLFMLGFYRLSGLVANISLLLYVMLLLLAMKLLGATLTLPGIAGIILSMGMAVDANVLIFERFKEEIRAGKTMRAGMEAGFSKAFSTILDSNITTLFAAAVLFYLGTGPIRGFAITLALGIVLSMFTAITVTRYMLKFFIGSNLIKNSKFFGA